MLFLNYTPDLTETDMTIYREIVKDMDAVVYMRIRDLAETTYCSTASIQRFCQKFDCSGWAEFKTKLRMYNNQSNHRGQLPNDIDGGEITRSIAACEDGQYQQAIDRAAHLLYEHSQVVWVGFGTSRIVADYGQ
ncbi:MurR/RpiR family transcriptional regulator [Lacticaseibacillus manihotivorans]|uniref:MurR/RpiR family transcriptional regulator n=1 Tax=Lacticaseibacillus manihotivorans TaxID=88233 RepID=UPI0006CFEACD|nr:hypothetical protein [Lacticaseibacillus manihotivorans]